MLENVIVISPSELLSAAQHMFFDGWRFVTASCVDLGEGKIDVTYHFDKNYDMTNYRIILEGGMEVPSISKIYFCALLVENEMKELFGVNVTDILIDYGGHLLITDAVGENPMLKSQITVEKRG